MRAIGVGEAIAVGGARCLVNVAVICTGVGMLAAARATFGLACLLVGWIGLLCGMRWVYRTLAAGRANGRRW